MKSGSKTGIRLAPCPADIGPCIMVNLAAQAGVLYSIETLEKGAGLFPSP